MASEVYTFPVLDDQELRADLADTGCPFLPDDLTHPTPARVKAVYEWWLNRMLGLNAEDIRRAADAQLDRLDHPDIYREAMYTGVFLFALNQLLSRCAVHDFTVKDLNAPTPARFKAVLSGIVNFFFFEQEQGDRILRPLEDEIEQLAQEEDQLVTTNAELRERLDKEREQRAANEDLMRQQQEANDRNVATLHSRRTEAAAIKSQGEKQRAALTELRNKQLELNQELGRLDLSISELHGKIISSPDKLEASIKELQHQVRRETDHVRDNEAKERALQAKINVLSTYANELHTCIRLLDEWQLDSDKLRDAQGQLDDHLELLQQLDAEAKELAERIQLLNRRIANGRDELTRLRERMQSKRDAAKARKKALEEQHAADLSSKKELDMQAAERNREAGEVEQQKPSVNLDPDQELTSLCLTLPQIRAMHASLQAELEKGEKAYKRIKDQITLYSIRMNKALDAINELNSSTLEL
ncbi:hypothetical protein JCM10207_003047 [Rhodosporidiobolus poonsookiae]